MNLYSFKEEKRDGAHFIIDVMNKTIQREFQKYSRKSSTQERKENDFFKNQGFFSEEEMDFVTIIEFLKILIRNL